MTISNVRRFESEAKHIQEHQLARRYCTVWEALQQLAL